VDLAAESGGNCELTRPDEEVVTAASHSGTHGPGAGMPIHASQMYSRNIEALVQHIVEGRRAEHRPRG
jgi:H+-translocating NAD(P) transhydrogenase subunit alpha